MNAFQRFVSGWILVVAVGFNLLSASAASASIGKISSIKGDVTLASGENITKISAPGAPVNDKDIIQTKDGEVQITFHDGSILRVNPFSSMLLQEREEESGAWGFKTKTAARRLTCLVGKAFFKSGKPGKKNYLQTPTAVAGLRGSEGDFGFDNIISFINIYDGQITVTGQMKRGPFGNPGDAVASKNPVYQAQLIALSIKEETKKVNAQVASEAQKKINAAEVTAKTLNVLKEAVAVIARDNPDPAVKQHANLIEKVMATSVAAVESEKALGKIQLVAEKAKETAEKAEAQGNEQTAEAAQKSVKQAEQSVASAQKAVDAAKQAAKGLLAKEAAGTLTKTEAEKTSTIVQAIAVVADSAAKIASANASVTIVKADAEQLAKKDAAKTDVEQKTAQETAAVVATVSENGQKTTDSVNKSLAEATNAVQSGDVAAAQKSAQVATVLSDTSAHLANTATSLLNAASVVGLATDAGKTDVAKEAAQSVEKAIQATAEAAQSQAAVVKASETNNTAQMTEAAQDVATQTAVVEKQQQATETLAQANNITTTVVTTAAPTTTVITTSVETTVPETVETTVETTAATTAETTVPETIATTTSETTVQTTEATSSVQTTVPTTEVTTTVPQTTSSIFTTTSSTTTTVRPTTTTTSTTSTVQPVSR